MFHSTLTKLSRVNSSTVATVAAALPGNDGAEVEIEVLHFGKPGSIGYDCRKRYHGKVHIDGIIVRAVAGTVDVLIEKLVAYRDERVEARR